MKVILLQDVKSLGKKGEIVNVNDGYARNFILPKKLGLEANNKNMNDLRLQKKKEERIIWMRQNSWQPVLRTARWSLLLRWERAEERSAPYPARKLPPL